MTATLANAKARMGSWTLVLLGMAALYLPSLIDAVHNAASADDVVNMAFAFAISGWFLRLRAQQLLKAGQLQQNGTVVGGAVLLAAGLTLYALGRSQQLPTLEIASLLPVLAGIVALFFGVRVLGRLWIVFFLLLFLVPLPASVASDITQPVKIAVSTAAETLLRQFDYPVARDGAILVIGQYQLLVADACSGLRSLFTLEALGLMYVTSIGHSSVLRNGLLAFLIVPISFAANTLRVVILTLVTYHFGDAAGQGFLHNFAGVTLFVSALLLIISVDALMARVARAFHAAAPATTSSAWLSVLPTLRAALRIRLRPALAVMTAMLCAAGAAHALTPQQNLVAMPDLEAALPARFGEWRQVESPYMQVALSTPSRDQPYDAVLMRSYEGRDGSRIMLALAYAAEQRQDVKIHRPEVCYPAQGFSIVEQHNVTTPVPGMQLLVRNRQRFDAVSYWIRIGDGFPRGVWAMRAKILRDGLAGRVNDGVLVRASSLISDPSQAAAAYAQQQRFLADLVKVVAARAPGLLVPVAVRS